MAPHHETGVFTEVDAAHRLGVSAAVLRSWRARGTGPVFHRFGRAVRYLAEDLEQFIETSAVSTTPQQKDRRAAARGVTRASSERIDWP
jgi:predicted site-specific integrase-resolvase